MKKVSAFFDQLNQFKYYVNGIITETFQQFVNYIKTDETSKPTVNHYQ